MPNDSSSQSSAITPQLRLEIEALSVEFAWLVDHGQADKAADLFTDNATLDNGEVFSGIGSIRGALEKRAALPTRSRHLISNVRLAGETPDRVRGTVVMTVHRRADDLDTAPETVIIAEADDVYERDAAGRWRFAQRRLTPIFMRTIGKE
jgi:hypothetical protein